MYVKIVTNTSIAGGDYERLTIQRKTNMTDHALVKDAVDHLAVIICPFGQALNAGSLGRVY
jgi:hypothetical protein